MNSRSQRRVKKGREYRLRLEFFSNAVCDPSGFGEGETFLGSTLVTTDGSGNASFTVTFLAPVPPGQFITATATDPDNNTSEFSKCQLVEAVVSAGNPLDLKEGAIGKLDDLSARDDLPGGATDGFWVASEEVRRSQSGP